jgi:hypothetical protein
MKGALRSIWERPRAWRYLAVGAVLFAAGGTTTAAATSTGLTELVYQAGSSMYFAHIDSGGNLAVNDSAAGTALGTANGHLANLETAGATANSTLSSLNTKLGGTLSVGISGTPTVLTGDTTADVASGTADVPFELAIPSPGNVIQVQTAAYRYLVLYITALSADGGSCYAATFDPNHNEYLLGNQFSVSATGTVQEFDPAPLNFWLTCSDATITGSTTYNYMLVGRP